MKTHAAGKEGFTLVELALAMIIIGLLIGGVLKGRQIIENAKVTGTIAQVSGYQAAVNGFVNRYGALPGDIKRAGLVIPGCDDVANRCADGNGDGLIGLPVGNAGDDVSSYAENIQFWKHLTLAGIVANGVSPAADPDNPEWGTTHPASNFRGGWHALYMNDVANDVHGLHLRLQTNMIGNMATEPGAHPVSPYTAANIDRKMDDGMSNGGTVHAEFGESGCRTGSAYNEIHNENCFMFFRID